MRDILTIQEFLSCAGFRLNKNKTKLVRHSDKIEGIPIEETIYHIEKLEKYQRCQRDPVFHGVDHIISFIGDEKNHGTFVGIYNIVGKPSESENDLKECLPDDKYHYNLILVEESLKYRGRLVIKWGNARQWTLWYSNILPIIEIKPQGRFKTSFQGYNNVILSFNDLEFIIKNKRANNDWYKALSRVCGIYVIVDKQHQKLYVGSASGKEGIWGRWSEYVKNKHGGNSELEKLIKNNPKAHLNFQFSILQVLQCQDSKIIQEIEELWKKKLGSRDFGLNKN